MRPRSVLLGPDPRGTTRWLALAAGLSVVVLAVVQQWGVPGPTEEVGRGLALSYTVTVGRVAIYAGGAAVLLALSAAGAYATGSVVASLALFAAPAAAWLATFFAEGADPGELPGAVAEGVLWAAFAAGVFGAVGHAAGSAARRRATGAGPDAVERLLVGPDPAATRRWLAGAVGLFAASLAVLLGLCAVAVAPPSLGGAGAPAATVGLVVLAAVGAGRTDALLVSWAVVAAPLAAFFLAVFALDAPRGLVAGTVLGVGLGVLVGAVPGTVGFLVGAAARRVRAGVAAAGPAGDR